MQRFSYMLLVGMTIAHFAQAMNQQSEQGVPEHINVLQLFDKIRTPPGPVRECLEEWCPAAFGIRCVAVEQNVEYTESELRERYPWRYDQNVHNLITGIARNRQVEHALLAQSSDQLPLSVGANNQDTMATHNVSVEPTEDYLPIDQRAGITIGEMRCVHPAGNLCAVSYHTNRRVAVCGGCWSGKSVVCEVAYQAPSVSTMKRMIFGPGSLLFWLEQSVQDTSRFVAYDYEQNKIVLSHAIGTEWYGYLDSEKYLRLLSVPSKNEISKLANSDVGSVFLRLECDDFQWTDEYPALVLLGLRMYVQHSLPNWNPGLSYGKLLARRFALLNLNTLERPQIIWGLEKPFDECGRQQGEVAFGSQARCYHVRSLEELAPDASSATPVVCSRDIVRIVPPALNHLLLTTAAHQFLGDESAKKAEGQKILELLKDPRVIANKYHLIWRTGDLFKRVDAQVNPLSADQQLAAGADCS